MNLPQWDLRDKLGTGCKDCGINPAVRDKPIRSFDFAQDKALPFALDGPHTTLWTASTLRLWTAPTLRSGQAKEWGDLLVPVTKQRRFDVMGLYK